MAKKKKKQGGGVPEWVMTYGDLMSLLLVFFVLIVSFSKIKKEDVKAQTEKIQDGFGIQQGAGRVPSPFNVYPVAPIPQKKQQQDQTQRNRSQSDQPGMHGERPDTRTIREARYFVDGGIINFQDESADLSNTARLQLRRLVEDQALKGTENILEIHGHAASMEYPDDPEARWQLTYHRAYAVYQFLTEEEGLDPERFRLVGNAGREPRVTRDHGSEQQASNRRATIQATNQVIEDYKGSE